MGKKKVEVMFAVELTFEDKYNVNKSTLKKYLERKVPNLKISTFRTFKADKAVIKTEILSNFTSLLKAEDLGLGKPVTEHTLFMEEEKSEGPDKLLNSIREIIATFGESSKQMPATEDLYKKLDQMENLTLELNERIQATLKENQHLKASIDFLSQSEALPAASTPIKIEDSQMEHTVTLMNKLQDENVKLTKRLQEAEERVRMFEKNVGEKIMMDQIKELETRLRNKDAVFSLEKQEFEERIRMLSLQILEKTDELKELEQSMVGDSKGNLVNTKKEVDSLKATLSATEQRLTESENEVSKLKAKLTEKKEKEKQLTNELARAIEDISKLKEDLNAYSIAPPEPRKIFPYIPLSNVAALVQEKEPEEKKTVVVVPQLTREERNKLSNLTAKLAEKEEEVTKLVCDFEKLQKCVLSMERDAKINLMQTESLTKEKVELMREIEIWRKKEGELKERINHLEQETTRKGIEIKQLEQMLGERNKALRESGVVDNRSGDLEMFKTRLIEAEKMNEKYREVIAEYEEELEVLRKFKEENEKSAEVDLKHENEMLTNKISSLESSIENLKRLLEIANADTVKLMGEVDEKDRLIEALKANTEEQSTMSLEKAIKENAEISTELAESRKVIEKLEAEIEKLSQKQNNEPSTLSLAKERIKHQEEVSVLKQRITSLERQVIDSSNNSTAKERLQVEIEKLQNEVNEKDAEIARLQKENVALEKKAGLKKPTKDIGENLEYLREIVYLYKTLINNAKERIEEKNLKEERLIAFSKIVDDMSDPKINKDKLKSIVTSSLQYFPYLAKFDIRTDYKFIVMGMVKVIEHKQQKLAQYRQDKERNSIVLEYSEPKYKAYSDKLNTMLYNKH